MTFYLWNTSNDRDSTRGAKTRTKGRGLATARPRPKHFTRIDLVLGGDRFVHSAALPRLILTGQPNRRRPRSTAQHSVRLEGSATVNGRALAEDEALYCKDVTAVEAGPEGATIWRWELVRTDSPNSLAHGDGVLSRLRMSRRIRMFELVPTSKWLFRLDCIYNNRGSTGLLASRFGHPLHAERPSAGRIGKRRVLRQPADRRLLVRGGELSVGLDLRPR